MMTSKLGARLREIMRPAAGRESGGGVSPSLPSADRDGDGPVGRPPGGAGLQAGRDPRSIGQRLAAAAAEALGGVVHETAAGPCLIIERVYPSGHAHGAVRIAECAAHVHGGAPGLPILAGTTWVGGSRVSEPGRPADAEAGDILFLDVETTGLAGGAGTYAFLVGCAWFDTAGLRVRQYFMVGHALERALLALVRERLESCGPFVTYNGKTFDVPLLETRFLFNRQGAPLGDRPHVDMLHPARRLWRGARPLVNVVGTQSESCTLAVLERALFGVQRTGDVPGFEIPTRYFAFLRSGDARPLEPVLEHNRLDLVSLAALTARACRLLAEPRPTPEHPRECVGLGRLLERAGACERAEECYRRAVERGARSWHVADQEARLEALHALALRCRRTARYLEAAAHWEAIARSSRCPPVLMREALEALAIHHEHRSRDLEQARRFAEQTLRVAGARPGIDQRLARLDRKMGRLDAAVPRATTLWR